MDRGGGGGGGEDAAGWWGVNQLISPRFAYSSRKLVARFHAISLTVDTSLTGETTRSYPTRYDRARTICRITVFFPCLRKIGKRTSKGTRCARAGRIEASKYLCIPSLTFSSREASFKTLQYQQPPV